MDTTEFEALKRYYATQCGINATIALSTLRELIALAEKAIPPVSALSEVQINDIAQDIYGTNATYQETKFARAILAAAAPHAQAVEPSDGEIYEAYSKRAAPEAHQAALDEAAAIIAAQPQPVAEQGELPKWIDDQKGKDPLMDDMINYIEGIRADLVRVYDAFGFHPEGRKIGVLMTNIENVIRFANMLHAIEREFFMVPGDPDDCEPGEEPDDVCAVNCWGSTLPEYVEQFRGALAVKAKDACAEERRSWDLTCSEQALEIEHLKEQVAAPAIQQPQDDQGNASQVRTLTREDIDRAAAACMETSRYALFMTKIDAALAKKGGAEQKPNADCSGDPKSCPDNEGYGCACDPMNKTGSGG